MLLPLDGATQARSVNSDKPEGAQPVRLLSATSKQATDAKVLHCQQSASALCSFGTRWPQEQTARPTCHCHHQQCALLRVVVVVLCLCGLVADHVAQWGTQPDTCPD